MFDQRLSNHATVPFQTDSILSLHRPTKQVLWIGCCDSSFREKAIVNLLPDEMLELRNMGNMIIDEDLSCETTIKHAVVDLQVKHIVVCGHYGCGIVRASSREGLKGPWLRNLNDLHATHYRSLDQLPTAECDRSFVELNILAQLQKLRRFPEVAEAMDRERLHIHGIVYDPISGRGLSVIKGEE